MSQAISSRQENNSLALWIRLLAGPIIWAAHFILGYLLVEAFCQTGLNFNILGINGLSFILVAITILAVVGSGYLGLQSYRGWGNMNKGKSFRERFKQTAHWTDEAVEFMYFSGFLLSVLFTATILMVGLPVFFLRTCG
jgi:hypothetical protein